MLTTNTKDLKVFRNKKRNFNSEKKLNLLLPHKKFLEIIQKNLFLLSHYIVQELHTFYNSYPHSCIKICG